MWRTLFYIPEQIGAVPLFGPGLLFWLWIAWAVGSLVWMLRRQGWTGEVGNSLLVYVIVAGVIAFLLPGLSVEIPGAFRPDGQPLRGLPVRGYGTMLLLAVLSAVSLALHRAKKLGFSADWVGNLALWCIIPGILGARFFHVAEYWSVHYGPIWKTQGPLAGLSAVLNVTQGGLVVYGSLLGGLAGIAVFAWQQRVRLLTLFDMLAPCFLLGLALGRLGCFLNGCCFGGICDLPWAVRFPAGSFAFINQAEHGQLALYGLKFRADRQHPQQLPVITEVLPDSAAARAGVTTGQHVAIVNGLDLSRQTGEPPISLLVAHLIALTGDPVIQEGGQGCACGCGEHAHQVRTVPRNTSPRQSEKHISVILQLQTAEGNEHVWESVDEFPLKSLPVHPSQLYSVINALILCLFLLAYEPFARVPGELWAWFLTVYPVTRFILEIIRADEPGSYWGLTISQVVSVGLFCLGVATWMVVLYRRWRLPRAGSAD